MTKKRERIDKESLDQFSHYLDELKQKGQTYREYGSQIQKEGTYILDWVNHAQQTFPKLASGLNWPHINDQAARWVDVLDNALSWLATNASQGTATAYFSSTIESQLPESHLLQSTEPTSRAPYMEPTDLRFDFSQLPHRLEYRQRACEQFYRLGLDKTTRGDNAFRQLNAAWDEHLKMASSTSMPLLAMRDSVNLVIESLIKLLPAQHPMKGKKKIVEIGKQVAVDYNTSLDFSQLQDEFDKLWNDLSGAKGGNYTRLEEQGLMVRATLWLVRLLSAIDRDKLRK